jgi:hypothetical protein
MHSYLLYLATGPGRIPVTPKLHTQMDFPDDDTAREAFMAEALSALADSYFISMRISKICDGKEIKVL